MVRFYGFSRNELDSTQGAPIFLSLEQHQPLFRVGFPSYLSLLALYPVLFERWVIGGISPCDLGEACDRGCIGLDQFCLSFPVECPVAVALEGADYPPFTSFLRMSAFCPYPKHLPLGMSNLLKDMFGCTVSGVVCPSSYHRIERPNNLHCQGLLMCVQVGTYVPYVFTDFFLLWDGQQLSLLPEFPDVKPQEVKSFCDMHNPGFSFTECQSSFLEKLLQAWSGVGFQYFSCGGRCHTSSRPGESHPQALTDPDVNLAAHPALTVQPSPDGAIASAQTTRYSGRPSAVSSVLSADDAASSVCTLTWPSAPAADPGSVASGTAPTCSTDHSR